MVECSSLCLSALSYGKHSLSSSNALPSLHCFVNSSLLLSLGYCKWDKEMSPRMSYVQLLHKMQLHSNCHLSRTQTPVL